MASPWKNSRKRLLSSASVQSADSPIAFDEVRLAKVKSNMVIPVTLKLKYSYTNNTDVKQIIRMVREMIDENGKVKTRVFGKWVMVPGEKDAINLNQPVASN